MFAHVLAIVSIYSEGDDETLKAYVDELNHEELSFVVDTLNSLELMLNVEVYKKLGAL